MKVKNPQLTAHSQTLRKRMTPEERKLWYEFLKHLPFTVHRQKVMGRYIMDFYLPSLRIVIEIDGMQHGDIVQARKDAQRDAWLSELGCRVLRYTNYQVNTAFGDVCEDIWLACGLADEDVPLNGE